MYFFQKEHRLEQTFPSRINLSKNNNYRQKKFASIFKLAL